MAKTCWEGARNICPSPPTPRYNIVPDLPAPPPPPLNPKTLQPLTADDLVPIFPMGALRCGASVVMRSAASCPVLAAPHPGAHPAQPHCRPD